MQSTHQSSVTDDSLGACAYLAVHISLTWKNKVSSNVRVLGGEAVKLQKGIMPSSAVYVSANTGRDQMSSNRDYLIYS